MLTTEFILTWLGIMFPMVFSPGPGNIVLVGSGISQGIKKSIPLILGINTIIFIYALLIGFGIDSFYSSYPNVFYVIKFAGIIYILYLAFKFLKVNNTDPGEKSGKTYSFYDGIILQLFNPKGLVMLLLMFSLFNKPLATTPFHMFYLVIMLITLNISCNFVWVTGGTLIQKFLYNKKTEKYLNYGFAFSLCMVAVWLLIEELKGTQ